MLKASVLDRDVSLALSLIEHRVTDVAVGPDDFSRLANVFAVVAPEASQIVEVADVVWMSPPVNFHLGKNVCLKDPLQLGDRGLNRVLLARVHIRVAVPIVAIDVGCNRSQSLAGRVVALRKRGDTLLLYERERRVDLFTELSLVHGAIRREIDMRRAIMAFN